MIGISSNLECQLEVFRYFKVGLLKKQKSKKARLVTHLLDWPKSRTLTPPNSGEDVEQQELLFVANGNVISAATLEDSLAVSYKIEHTITIQSSHHAPWYLPKEVENFCPNKNLYIDFYRSFINNC